MTRLAALVACGLALVALGGRLAWQANLPTPIDLNVLDMLADVALVIMGASVAGHVQATREE